MSEKLIDAIEVLAERIQRREAELYEQKKMVNSLCREAGRPVLYPDAEQNSPVATGAISPDEYYGKSPTVAAREYLQRRTQAVPAEEILNALVQGGFDFEAQGWTAKNRLRNLTIAMSKNSGIFHRLPNKTYGLLKWYPEEVKKREEKRTGKNGNDSEGASEEEGDS